MPEAVFYGQVELRGSKQTVKDIFQLSAVQVVEFVFGDYPVMAITRFVTMHLSNRQTLHTNQSSSNGMI